MVSWLEQARIENAGISEIVAEDRRFALRTAIDVRLRRRRSVRNAAVFAATASLGLVLLSTVARQPQATPRSAHKTVAGETRAVPAPSAQWPVLRLADGSRAIALGASAQLVLERDDVGGTRVSLGAGAARFEVEPRAGKPFVVVAGPVSVHVVGTRFSVIRSNAQTVEVSVEHGEVAVEAGAERVRLHAGERRTFEAAKPASDRRARRDPAAELLAAADLARREGRSEHAVAALQTLVQRHPRDPRAPSAAFSLGRVLLEAQHQPQAAARAFALVAKLDPHSPLLEDARAREIEAWARAGEQERARELARAYLRDYPHGVRAALVRRHAQLQ